MIKIHTGISAAVKVDWTGRTTRDLLNLDAMSVCREYREGTHFFSSKSYLETVTKARSPATLGIAAEGRSRPAWKGVRDAVNAAVSTDEISWLQGVWSRHV
jgi:hypothetical protein